MNKFTLNMEGCQFTAKWHQAGAVASSNPALSVDHWTLDVTDIPSKTTGKFILPGNWAFSTVVQYIAKLHDGLFGQFEVLKENEVPIFTP